MRYELIIVWTDGHKESEFYSSYQEARKAGLDIEAICGDLVFMSCITER